MSGTTNFDLDNNNLAAVKCIFLCEFHATVGPKIAAQVPENYISKELFDTVNRYIIPKLQLQRSFLSVSLLGRKILGYPVRIDNNLYARNAFYFNFCFVFAPQTRTVVYEPVVRKLTEYMLSMELSTKILSQVNDQLKVKEVTNILKQIRTDINHKKMCMLLDGSTMIPLCVVPYDREIPIIHPHGAAVLNINFHKYVYNQWDLTTLRILPYVNGFNHLNRISAMADVALALVLDCIKHLVVLGVAVVVPVFQYSNVYRPTPKLSQLAKCKALQSRCVEKCSKSSRIKAKVRDIFRMFASMSHGATFGELCVRFNPAGLNINEKQMVLFGLLEGLIRRVDKYPITVSRNLFIDEEIHNISMISAVTTTSLTSTTPVSTEVSTVTNCSNQIVTPQRNKMTRISRPLLRHTTNSSYNNNILFYHLPNNNNRYNFDQKYLNLNKQQQQQQQHQHYQHYQHYQQQQHHHHHSPHHHQPYYYNGLKTLDEVSCMCGISCQQLEMQLARDRHVIVLLK